MCAEVSQIFRKTCRTLTLFKCPPCWLLVGPGLERPPLSRRFPLDFKGTPEFTHVRPTGSETQYCCSPHPDIEYVDLAPYSEKPISVIKGLFKYWFDQAAFHRPSVLILDNIEHLLKAEEENTDSFRTRQLVELFVHLFSSSPRSASPNARGIVLLATAPSVSALHPLLNSRHVFTETIHVKAPNKDARRDVSRQRLCPA